MYIAHFVYLFSHQWTLCSFPPFGCCDSCCCEHWCTNICLLQYVLRVPTVAQWLKDLALLQLWCRSQQQLGFDPWLRNFHMPRVRLKEKKKDITRAQVKSANKGVEALPGASGVWLISPRHSVTGRHGLGIRWVRGLKPVAGPCVTYMPYSRK